MFDRLFGRYMRPIVINETITVEITDEDLVEAHEKRVTELLNHNNAQLEENRSLKRRVAELEAQLNVG